MARASRRSRFFCFLTRRSPSSTLFPCTTLFRSYSLLYAEARVELGGLALTARDVELAERRFGEARSADAHSFGAAVGLAQCAEIRKDLERAWAYWRESIDIRPESVPARFKLADILSKLGRAEEAKAACQKVLELQPGHPDAAELLRRVTK